jgi:four helix bundle protein
MKEQKQGTECKPLQGTGDRVQGSGNKPLQSFKELIVWQKAYQFALNIYQETNGFPKSEIYGLTSQLRRCAVSIVSNIAEGYQRQHLGEYMRFLSISLGSCAEAETQLILAQDLNYISEDSCVSCLLLLKEISRILQVMITKLRGR